MNSGFHLPKLPGFRIPDYLIWGEVRIHKTNNKGNICIYISARKLINPLIHKERKRSLLTKERNEIRSIQRKEDEYR